MVPNSELLIDFIGNEESVKVVVNKEHAIYSDDVIKQVCCYWESLSKSKHLFDGTNAILEEYSFDDGILTITLKPGNYSEFYCLNIKQILPELYTNTLAICTAPITSDNLIVIGKRSQSLAEGNEEWHVVGGTFDERVLNGMSPTSFMKEELKEELNIDSADIEEISYLGLGINHIYHKPELLTYTKLSIKSEELIEKMREAIDFDEHSEIEFLQFDEIKSFLLEKKVAPIGELCINRFQELLLKEKL